MNVVLEKSLTCETRVVLEQWHTDMCCPFNLVRRDII